MVCAEDFTLKYNYDNVYKYQENFVIVHNISLQYDKKIKVDSKYGKYISETTDFGVVTLSTEYIYWWGTLKSGLFVPVGNKLKIDDYEVKKTEGMFPYISSELKLNKVRPFILYSYLDSSAVLNPFSIQMENSKIAEGGLKLQNQFGDIIIFYFETNGDIKLNEIIDAAEFDIGGYGIGYQNKYMTFGIARIDVDVEYNISQENSSIISLAGESIGNIKGDNEILFGKIGKKFENKTFGVDCKLLGLCLLNSDLTIDATQNTKEYKVISLFPFLEMETVNKTAVHKFYFDEYAFGGIASIKAEKKMKKVSIYIKKMIPFGGNLKMKDKYEVKKEVESSGETGTTENKKKEEIPWEKIILSGLSVGIECRF